MFSTSFVNVNSKIFFLEADYYQDKTQEKKITVGKGEIISSDNAFKRVAISGPNIADIQVLNEKQIFLRAKNLGITTFLAWEKDVELPTRYDILVLPDIKSLSAQLQELDENIEVKYIPPSTSLSSASMSGGSQGFSGTDIGGETGSEASATSLQALPSGGSQGGSEGSSEDIGRIILKGEVKNAEVIARALQIAGAYVGDQGVKIISQPGGQVVDGLAGEYDIHSNSDRSGGGTGGGNSAVSFGSRDSISFTSNRYANLSRGVIATTQNGTVVSFLTVKDPPQIAVAIRFYEVQRNVTRNLGLNVTLGGHTLQGGSFVGGNGISMIIGGIASIAKLNSFMAGDAPEFTFGPFGSAGGSFLGQSPSDGVTGALFYPKNGVGALIQALLERGEIKSLAEPTLVITNGEPASFLAGGEVPIVRSVFTAGGASQDITYEPFGIRFTLLPTVTKGDNIHLQLVPEIRDIDTELSNFVVPPGSTQVRPPAFRTRRTQTQVELKPGQAFAISGLLREDNTRNLRKVPGLGDVPVLGGLFRSKSFRNGETELLVVVSPQIVRATDPEKVAELSTTDIPYDEFNQLAPLRPYIEMMDEVGPDIKQPLDPGKYNEVVGYKGMEPNTAHLAPKASPHKIQTSWLDFNTADNITLRSSVALR
ncbi:MAG: pilus assembly protein N-terminal domain-containing protein [Candidatus Melainabacteria bacterium]|nr:pilus assembly protein N-terminal domain-containing protein [Candidatus Melainabacteria bacterium]